MTHDEKLEAIAEIFEVSDVTAETQLDDLNWDSMAMLSVMAVAKNNGNSVTGQQLREAKTVADLMAIM